MKAVIMAGGFGTRLRPLTCNLPKPMAPVLNRPILEHTIRLLKRHGIDDIIILMYYLPQYIESHFGNGSAFGVRIEYLAAEEDFGTAGAVKLAETRISDPCLIVSGDALTNLDLTRFIAFHKRKHALMTLALSQEANPSPFGIAITDQNSRISRFLEKPSWGQIFSDTVNMGIYVMEPRVFDLIPEREEFYFARDLFPKLIQQGEPLYGFLGKCYWKDIGDLKTYQLVHWHALQKQIDLEIAGDCKNNVWRNKSTKVAKDVLFEGHVVLGSDARIESGAKISNCVVGDRCYIGAETELRDTILWNDVHIGRRCQVMQSVIGNNSHVGDEVVVDENVFISDDVDVGSGVRIYANVRIWPRKQIELGSTVNSSVVWGDRWRRELFTNSRVSGLANFEITPEFGAKLGLAYGAWIGKSRDVIISRDATPAARMIYRAIISGLMSAGIHVNDLQVMPIPIVRYTLRNSTDFGGVHIRRSPFERDLMDILFFDHSGRDHSPAATRSIERIFFREDFPRVSFDDVGDIDYPVRIIQAYVRDFLAHIDLKVIQRAAPRIVIDYAHGAAAESFPSILGALHCEVIALNAHLEPEKLTKTRESFEAALKQLSQIVKSTGAEAGFLLDAGAEKVFCVDEKGNIIPSQRLAVLLARLVLETQPPRKIAVPVSAPGQIVEMARTQNIEVVFTQESPGSLIKATEDPEVGFAVEGIGGLIFPEFHFAFDGLFSVVKIMELLAKSGQTLGKLNAEIPRRVLMTSSVPCPWEAKGRVMRELDRYSADKPRVLIDGVKIMTEEGWVLMIPDREKAFYHILAEAEKISKARKLVKQYEKRVANWINHDSSREQA